MLARRDIPGPPGHDLEEKASSCPFRGARTRDSGSFSQARECRVKVSRALGVVEPACQEGSNAFVCGGRSVYQRVEDGGRTFEWGATLEER
jgi:hypothetical protein